MPVDRRQFLGMTAAALVLGPVGITAPQRGEAMFGLIGKMTAVEGERDALIEILLEGVAGMPAGGHGLDADEG